MTYLPSMRQSNGDTERERWRMWGVGSTLGVQSSRVCLLPDLVFNIEVQALT